MKELILKHNAAVPRYTSYPTAPHFTPEDATASDGWLGRLDRRDPVSLYLHIPFCHTMCWYCGCHTQATRQYAPVGDYVGLLARETELVRQGLGFVPGLSHLHFGGGSPSMLTACDVDRLMKAVTEKFTVQDGAELALEADPRGATQDRVSAYAAWGINRASFGIQDFTPAVQQAINRVQDFATVERAAALFRRAGIDALNFDLMYGLPLQTVQNLRDTVDLSLRLEPQRIALFGYAHVPWMKKHMRLIREQDLPDAGQRLDQFEAAAERLIAAGYRLVGLDHFVRADDAMFKAQETRRLSRNFQGYTTDRAETLIGLGVSAISRHRDGYLQNASDMTTYKKALDAGRLPVARGRRLVPDDRLRAEVISELMCYFDCDLEVLLARHGMAPDYFDDVLAGMDDLAKDKAVTISRRTIIINPLARQIARIVAARFDRYFSQNPRRHVQAA